MKVKSHFEDVDQLIAKVQLAAVKNKTSLVKFATICSPQPVVTRWVSCLNAALYYGKNLIEVKAIVQRFEGFGILVTKAKVTLQTTG